MIIKPRRPWWRRWLKRVGWVLLALLVVAICVRIGRHYSIQGRLEEALTELDRAEPGWRLADIEAAREQIPEEENSARVVIAAAKLLPKQWPPQEFDSLFGQFAPEEQLAPDDFARLKQELDNVRPALKEARKLADMPRGRHHIEYKRFILDTVLNDQQETRRIVSLLNYDALRNDQKRDMKAALLSSQAALNAARSLGDEPFAISQLVRMSGVILSCRALERTLAQGEPSPEMLAERQQALDGEDAFPDLITVARGERASLHETFEAIERGDVPLNHQFFGPRPSWEEYAYGWSSREKFREAHPRMISCMTGFLDIARFPMHLQAKVERQHDVKLRVLKDFDPLAVLFIPDLMRLNDASRRKHAYLRCMLAGLAAERYRQVHKDWPESLDKLCPQFLADVPRDPFAGEPLCYRRVEEGVVIYSVGSDGVDNNGNLDPAHANQPGVDIGCRLWDVAKRRQPPCPKQPKDDLEGE
jgi:hypothetical protein